uniref:Uncharacterized protein n=1 Tax=Cacopsylla melanoneura TaxID=428564 RepID=A0A8D8YCE5_9HEMI
MNIKYIYLFMYRKAAILMLMHGSSVVRASVWQSRVQGTPVRNPSRTEYVIWVFPRNNATWCFLDWILDDPVKISCACGGLKTRVLELKNVVFDYIYMRVPCV